jgi:CheY-like chemotaxis protein
MHNTSLHHILIVDDNQDSRYYMNSSFRELQWDDNIKLIESASRMLQYLEALAHTATSPTLILLNSNLQLISCEEVMTHLKNHSRFRNIPIIVYSSDMNEAQSSKLQALGALSCLKKQDGKSESKKLAEYIKQLTINHSN